MEWSSPSDRCAELPLHRYAPATHARQVEEKMRTAYPGQSIHSGFCGRLWRWVFARATLTFDIGFCSGVSTPAPQGLFLLIGALAFACAPVLAQEDLVVQQVRREAHPGIPAGLKLVCLMRPGPPKPVTWPVLEWRGVSYWAYSFIDNRDAMAIVAYDARGDVLRRSDRRGARYLESILVKQGDREVLFLGQGNRYIRSAGTNWTHRPPGSRDQRPPPRPRSEGCVVC